MSICEKCQDKKCLKTKKPCEAVEKLLRKDKVFSRNYIRPKIDSRKRLGLSEWREIPFSSMNTKWQEAQGFIDPKEN